jgi:transcriptional regulator with XRE-family HTH domain
MVEFGKYIATKRKEMSISLKDLAVQIKKEDGSPITPQYLNDIERGRRNPPSESMIRQLGIALEIPPDILFHLAGKVPDDIGKNHPPESIQAAYKAFRKVLNED